MLKRVILQFSSWMKKTETTKPEKMTMIEEIVGKMTGLAKPRQKFLVMVMRTILMMRGRVNYTNLSRYSESTERTFRRQYVKPMDFGKVNHEIVRELKMEEQTLVLAMDATFIGKSGKHTPGLGRYWNGSDGRAEKGLEVSLVAVVNVETKRAYALEARQTGVSARLPEQTAPAVGVQPPEAVVAKAKTKPKTKTRTKAKPGVKTGTAQPVEAVVAKAEPKSKTKAKTKSKATAKIRIQSDPPPTTETFTRIDDYLDHLRETKPYWPPTIRYGVFDGLYTKRKFVDGVCGLGLHLIGKLRSDANLRFLYTGPQKPRGRRRRYAGKVDFTDLSRFEAFGEIEPHVLLYAATLFHVSLKRVIRICLLVNLTHPDQPRLVVLFSTDETLDPKLIVAYYIARFQIEFLFRDAKQFTGLTHCQARNPQALDFHFNASFTAVNFAKLETHLARSSPPASPFSLASYTCRAFNHFCLDRVISLFDLDPQMIKNHPNYSNFCEWGTLAS